ncbi:MAG: type II secretion system F family protein [Actinomycetota bacterium]|nr:type II secretion system F family protein [Actinomycetota bacterium]
MSTAAIGGAVGFMVAGLPGALVGAGLATVVSRRRSVTVPLPTRRLVLLLLLVELRSGLSVLAALQGVSEGLPDDHDLRRVARVATVSGLTSSLSEASPRLRPLVAQLARAQRSGSSLSNVVRVMLDQDIATERAERLSKARSLPVRLMIPVTLLMLPGLVLMLYAPSLLRLFDDLIGAWS